LIAASAAAAAAMGAGRRRAPTSFQGGGELRNPFGIERRLQVGGDGGERLVAERIARPTQRPVGGIDSSGGP